MKELLEKIVDDNRKYIKDGAVATYIPALGKVNPNLLGLSLADIRCDGYHEYSVGDSDVRFAIESTSKVISLALAILDNGLEYVFSKVGTEPTHFAFNSILNMQIRDSKKPTNPFINAGAITVTSLIKGKNSEEKIKRILDFMRKITNDDNINVNKEIYLSEKKTGNINRSLAYYMESHNMIEGDVEDILDAYFMQCSIEVNTLDLARIGVVLANKGVMPWNGERIIPMEVCTIIKSLMTTCGLYDESGEFAVHIGIPAKSGVGGGILGSVPNKMGIGIFGPSIDKQGNSTAGVKILQDLSKELVLDIFE